MIDYKDISEGIVVKKDGLYYYSWHEGQQVKKVNSLLKWLNIPLYIDDDVTFEDFFNYVMIEHEYASKIFYSHLGGWSLSKWKDEWEKEDPMVEEKNEKVFYTEVYWSVEIDDVYGLSEFVGFHAKGKNKSKSSYGDNNWHDVNFSFSMSPLNKMKHYLFKIDNTWQLIDFDELLKDKDKKYEGEIKTTKLMTVYDVIGGILDDISFYGSPENRDMKSDELDERVKEFLESDEFVEAKNAKDFLSAMKEELKKKQ